MLEEIVESIQLEGSEFVPEKQTRVKGFSAGALGFSLGLTFSDEVRDNYGFRTKLSLLCDRLGENGRKVLLLVDEVQPNSDAMRALASTYQHLAGEGKDIAIVMAGLPGSISRVLNDKVLTFLNRARKQHLGPLRAKDVMEYYSEAFEREHRGLPAEQLVGATKATQGFPYLLQLIGYYMVEFSNEGETIDDRILEKAIAASRMDLVEDVFSPTLNGLSEMDATVLRSIAKQGDVAKVSDVIADLGVNNSYFQQYRARLIDSKVIDSPREGAVEISVPYLGDYLAERRS